MRWTDERLSLDEIRDAIEDEASEYPPALRFVVEERQLEGGVWKTFVRLSDEDTMFWRALAASDSIVQMKES